MVEPVVSRCSICGTQYTARAWFWLEPLDDKGTSRACAVPGCGFAVKRIDQVGMALRDSMRNAQPKNDGGDAA